MSIEDNEIGISFKITKSKILKTCNFHSAKNIYTIMKSLHFNSLDKIKVKEHCNVSHII